MISASTQPGNDMRSDYKHWISIPTRWRDMDSMGHVNSAVYFTYFEIARMWYFGAVGLPNLKVHGKVGPAVVSQACNYREQVFHPSILETGVRSTKLGNKSFTVDYEIYLQGSDKLVCDGHTVMVWVDYEIAKAIPIPTELREGIERFERELATPGS